MGHFLGRLSAVFLRGRRLCVLTALLCGVTTVAGDDTRATAVSITVNSSANGSISSGDDVDYWRIEVPSRGLLEVETSGSTDTLGELQDSFGNRIDDDDDEGAGENFKIVVAVAAGTYYIRVSGYSFEHTGPYTLHVRHVPAENGSDENEATQNSTVNPPLGDFNGDGKDDVLLRNEDGRWWYYPMDGRRHIVSQRGLAALTPNLAWQFAGIGDLNGDGKDDVLVRHEDGRWFYYPMDGRYPITNERGLANLTRNLDWHVAGMGDLNGDGRDDVLLRHTNGRWYYYPMNGRRHITDARGYADLTRDLDWQVAGIGDLNGDGKDDVLLRHTDGRWDYYPMDGRNPIAAQRGLAGLTRNLDWQVVGMGDLNGDGRDDVLLRHTDSRWYYYPMDGRRFLTEERGHAGLTRNLDWQVAGIGDLNGDGRDDVLLRHTDRRWYYYPMDGRSYLADERGYANLTRNPDWSIAAADTLAPAPPPGDGNDDSVSPEMVSIPAGAFQMGDLSGTGVDSERPVHSVTLRPFKLGKYEVTFAQWDACVADGGCNGYRPDDRGWGRGNRALIYVSWFDAQAFINWLNGKTGGNYRLPTEAEWEYAARAGSTTLYSWGDDIGHNQAFCIDCGSPVYYAVPVGSFPANAWGLHDMFGNVEEWVQDCWHFDGYQGAPSDGSAWTSGGDCSRRVNRGGHWGNTPWAQRSAIRGWDFHRNRGVSQGFRLAQDN